jgi:hypothetical protein
LWATGFSSRREPLRGVVLVEHGVHATPGVFDVNRHTEEGDACPLQGLGGLDGVNGKVEGCAQVHDGGVQDVLLDMSILHHYFIS